MATKIADDYSAINKRLKEIQSQEGELSNYGKYLKEKQEKQDKGDDNGQL